METRQSENGGLAILNAEWRKIKAGQRSFVRHRNEKGVHGKLWRRRLVERPVLSVIIPTTDGVRGGKLSRLLDQVAQQNFLSHEVILVVGDSRQGRAINLGASASSGAYLMTLDDDSALTNSDTFGKLVHVMASNPDIGIAGGNNVIPKDAGVIARRAMKEIPRRSWMPVREITDSDLAEHPCMIMRLSDFKAAGGENEFMPRGLDPYLREQFRRMGKRVVLVPNVIYHHLPPNSLPDLIRQFYRNGRHAAFVNRHYPEWVYETPAHHGEFRIRRSSAYRLIRFPMRLLKGLSKGMFIFFICELSYAFGFLKERISERCAATGKCP